MLNLHSTHIARYAASERFRLIGRANVFQTVKFFDAAFGPRCVIGRTQVDGRWYRTTARVVDTVTA